MTVPIVPGNTEPSLTWMPTPPPRRRKLWPWVAAASVLAVAAIVAAVIVWLPVVHTAAVASSKTQLRVANDACRGLGELSDGDKTLFLDMMGKQFDTGRMSESDVACVLGHLNVPTFVTKHMEQTRALDGRQSDTWADFNASWTYHPDQGLDVLIHEK